MTNSTNSTVSVPVFTVGTTSPILVTATKLNQNQTAEVGLQVSDRAGIRVLCDPVVANLIRFRGEPGTTIFRHLPQSESQLQLTNGEPGLTRVVANVNGRVFHIKDLRAGDTSTLGVSSAMRADDDNTIAITVHGPHDGSATLVISD